MAFRLTPHERGFYPLFTRAADIMIKLNSTFVTPFDREDIYRLASSLDDVLDLMEEAADRIVLYRLGVLPPGIAAQVEVLQQAAAATAEAMPRLGAPREAQRVLRARRSRWRRC